MFVSFSVFWSRTILHDIARIFCMTLPAIAVSFLICSPQKCPGQESEQILSPKMAALAKNVSAGRMDVVEKFWKEFKGKAPLIEKIEGDDQHLLVTFIWRGDAKRVVLHGGLPAAELFKPLTRLRGSDVWYRTERLHRKSRVSYGFRINAPAENPKTIQEIVTSMAMSSPQPDPENPRRIFTVFSVLELPDAPAQPWITARKNVKKGVLKPHKVHSKILGKIRDISVYVPPVSPKDGFYHLLVLFDGEGHVMPEILPTPTILDNLIASKKIPPTVAVFVNGGESRNRDMAFSSGFTDFVATELVPWVRKKYRITTNPAKCVIGGMSLAGHGAAYCGFRHSEVFGNVLSQSGSFGISPGFALKFPEYDTETGWLTKKFAKSPKRKLRFYLEIGLFERFYEVNSVLENRRFRDVLTAKGYPIVYSEFYGGHDVLCLRGSLADGLIALLGMDQSGMPKTNSINPKETGN